MRLSVLFFIVILSGPMCLASGNDSGWSSGGGHVAPDFNNPWFLASRLVPQKKITYCIKHDRKNFSRDVASSQILIEKAFNYWKTEIDSLSFSNKSGFSIIKNFKFEIC